MKICHVLTSLVVITRDISKASDLIKLTKGHSPPILGSKIVNMQSQVVKVSCLEPMYMIPCRNALLYLDHILARFRVITYFMQYAQL